MYGLLITQSRWSGSSTLGSMESLQTSHDFWKTCIMQSIGRTKEEGVEPNNNENQFTIISCNVQKTIQTKTFSIRLYMEMGVILSILPNRRKISIIS